MSRSPEEEQLWDAINALQITVGILTESVETLEQARPRRHPDQPDCQTAYEPKEDYWGVCPDCNGSGSFKNSLKRTVTCDECRGSGRI